MYIIELRSAISAFSCAFTGGVASFKHDVVLQFSVYISCGLTIHALNVIINFRITAVLWENGGHQHKEDDETVHVPQPGIVVSVCLYGYRISNISHILMLELDCESNDRGKHSDYIARAKTGRQLVRLVSLNKSAASSV